tara:strand:+ start:630 stop:752 length:123 start_codon:yes stop_codon:yes gene_type:complete
VKVYDKKNKGKEHVGNEGENKSVQLASGKMAHLDMTNVEE